MKILWLFLVLVITSSAVHAADGNGQYAIWGLGASSCHKYNLARQAGDAENYRNYIMGFFSAYNIMEPDTYRISGDMDIDAVLVWFDDECGEKPIVSFDEVMGNFVTENYENRLKRAPTRLGR